MSDEEVHYGVEGGLATVTLNRPRRLNAWTPTMGIELREAMRRAENDDTVRAIILTGAGRGFCAGLDRALLEQKRTSSAEMASALPDAIGEPFGDGPFQGRFTYFPSIGKPIIAAINGAVAGSAMLLALSCDVRFASRDAVFTTSFARRGLIAEHGIAWLLPRLVGQGHALDLLLSARRVSADEALRMGLVNEVVTPDALLDRCKAYACDLAGACSPRSLAIIKRQVWEARLQTFSEACTIADREMVASFGSTDFRNSSDAQGDKRASEFTAA